MRLVNKGLSLFGLKLSRVNKAIAPIDKKEKDFGIVNLIDI